MFRKKIVLIVLTLVISFLAHSAIGYENDQKLFSYNGRPTYLNLSNATVVDADRESPEIIEKLKTIEDISVNDISESVWMVIVPSMRKGAYYGPPEVQFSFGSAVVFSPGDPAFGMSEYDMDAMGNYGVAKKNFDKEAAYLDTNFHVIDGWDAESNLPLEIKKIFITPDGREKIVSYKAELVGTAPREDLAVLKINGVKLPALSLGDLSKVSDYQKKWGYQVTAFGAPYIFEGTPSNGKAFYPAKDLTNIFTRLFGATTDTPLNGERYQINALIHPGNSGGLLAGTEGENKNKIIGKPCSGYPGSSVNFAIPDYIIREIIPQILAEKVHYPYYSGLITAEPNAAVRDPLNAAFFKKLGFKSVYYEALENIEGALVVGFMDDSPFKTKAKTLNPFSKKPTLQDEKDIQYGDVITVINGMEVENPHDFLKKLRAIKNDDVSIRIKRFEKTISPDGEKWTEKEIIIERTKKDLTVSEDQYKNMYHSIKMNGFSAIMSAGEIRGERIPFKTELILK